MTDPKSDSPQTHTAVGGEIFDDFARSYKGTVARAIRLSGESVEYFTEIKVERVRMLLNGSSVRSILDFGCGTGTAVALLSQRFPNAKVVGVDPSAASIAIARANAPLDRGVEYHHNLQKSLPFAPATFDVVFTACVFHHIARADHLAWARELFRTLTPGGSLLIFEHNPLNPLTRKVVRDCPFDKGVTLLSAGYAHSLLREAGFSVGDPHFYFFFPHILRTLRHLEPMLSSVPLGGQYYIHARKSD